VRPLSDSQIEPTSNVLQRIAVEVNEHASAIALVWMVLIFGQMIRMAAALYRVGRIRRHGKLPPTDVWMERLAILAAQLGIKRKVSLLQTGSVNVPAVIGFLKPAILLPFGILANLPPDQVETVLLHELAHIKRNDLLTNLLVHLAEIVFFFNPGLRWLCSLIRREREACCDDIVLERAPDKITYFEALVAFQRFAAGGGRFALQLAGGRSDLLWRMKRMLAKENKKLQLMEKTFLSFGLVALVAVGLLSMKTGDKQTPNAAGFHRMAATSLKMDTIPDTSLKAKTVNPGKRSWDEATGPAMPAPPATPTMMADSVAAHRPNYDYFGHVIYDLRADGLIESVETLSFTLDNDGLVVNGVKQPESVYQKYKAKYLRDPADHVIYIHNGGHWHTDVWMENK
jgi:beta-lactamase regulating signal transducer with metallopeptidase domain